MKIYTGIKYHKLPIYPQAVLYCIGVDYKSIVDYVKEYISDTDHNELREEYFSSNNKGYTIFLKDSMTVVIWINEEYVEDLGTITHELFHCTEFIMEDSGVVHAAESSEAFAYLLTHLSDQLLI